MARAGRPGLICFHNAVRLLLLEVRLTRFFSHAPLPIVFFLIDVDSGHLSSCRGSRHGAQGAKCLHAFIRFYPGVRGLGTGSARGRQTRPYVAFFSTCRTEGQTRWVMEDSSEEEVGGSPQYVFGSKLSAVALDTTFNTSALRKSCR